MTDSANPDMEPRVLDRLLLAPSALTLRHVGALALLIGALMAATKLHKVRVLGTNLAAPPGALDHVVAVAADLTFALCWAICWALALSGRRFRGAAAVSMHLLATLLLLFTVVEHGFFLATGALLDWDLLAYSVRHLAKIKKVIASEMGLATWLALAGVVALAWLPALARLGRAAAVVNAQLRTKGAVVVAAVLALTVATAVAGPDLPERLQPIAANAASRHVVEAVTGLLGTADAQGAKAYKPIEPVILARPDRNKPQHNVVLIVLESVRARSTTPYNKDLGTTPFMARLAARGTVVENAYTVVPHTTKSLIPIHCGIYPKLVKDFEEASAGSLPSDCLARLLARQGYATHYIQSPESVFERRRDLIKAFGFQGIRGMEQLPKEGFEYVGYFGHEDDVMVEPGFEWVDKQTDPFFLAYLTVITHHPYEVPKSFAKGDWKVGKKLSKYYDAIAYTDRFLAKIFAGFEARGLLDETIFVLVGDHGEAFGEHGTFQHDQTPYEEGLKVPLLLVGPGIPAGKRVPGLWQHVDIMPTILDALGLEVVAGELPGLSVLKGKGHERVRFACWQAKRCQAMRQGDTKTIHFFDRRPAEVFDLKTDPMEKTNLLSAGKVDKAEVQARVDDLKAWTRAINGRYEAQQQRRSNSFISDSAPEKIARRADIKFDKMVRLIGYDVDRTELADGEAVWLTWYFEVLRDPGPGWKLFVHAVGPRYKGKVKRIHGDHVPVEGSHPISAWKKGQFITDRQWMRVRPGYPSGDYEVLMGLYNPDKKNRRAVPTGTGVVITANRSLHATTLRVRNPKRPFKAPPDPRTKLNRAQRRLVGTAPPADLGDPVTVDFDGVVRIIGVHKDRVKVRAGESVTWTWHFQVLKQPPRWTGMFAHVNGPRPKTSSYINAIHDPVLGGLPFHHWRPGDFISDPHEITVPKGFPAGVYDLWMGFWDPNLKTPLNRYMPRSDTARIEGKERRVHMGTITVTGP